MLRTIILYYIIHNIYIIIPFNLNREVKKKLITAKVEKIEVRCCKTFKKLSKSLQHL